MLLNSTRSAISIRETLSVVNNVTHYVLRYLPVDVDNPNQSKVKQNKVYCTDRSRRSLCTPQSNFSSFYLTNYVSLTQSKDYRDYCNR